MEVNTAIAEMRQQRMRPAHDGQRDGCHKSQPTRFGLLEGRSMDLFADLGNGRADGRSSRLVEWVRLGAEAILNQSRQEIDDELSRLRHRHAVRDNEETEARIGVPAIVVA